MFTEFNWIFLCNYYFNCLGRLVLCKIIGEHLINLSFVWIFQTRINQKISLIQPTKRKKRKKFMSKLKKFQCFDLEIINLKCYS